ncbi:hypothetical protein [Rhabdaerophilum sp. SD176]|uniref:hypothetical protein n=1 Tax=Rhabdaerophilum sp. SD176 TaxID=2983548 RepID=UPI0024DF5169|nr:hypothetical protein [Rhabdaerophilum sp. SD176]
MKTVLAAAFAAATLFAGAAQAAEATHGGVQVRSTAVQPPEQAQNTGFGGLSVQREVGPGKVVPTNDPARGAYNR